MRIVTLIAPRHMAISNDERAFFIDLGSRITAHRKEQGITQMQLAEILGVSQQAMNSFEKGRRRLPVSALPPIARALDVSLEQLIGDGEHTPKAPKKRGPAPKLEQQLKRVGALPKAKQRAVMQVLDSMLAQAGR